jgi:hypothetical protein
VRGRGGGGQRREGRGERLLTQSGFGAHLRCAGRARASGAPRAGA